MNIRQFVKIVVFLTILVGCNSSPQAFYQTNDGEKLLIQPNELPVSWQLQTSWDGPFGDDATDWRKLYIPPKNFDRDIVSSATIFEEETVAIQYWEEEYLPMKTLLSSAPCLTSLEQSARSQHADQVEFLCFDADNSLKQIGAYEYFVIARYGNVVSTLGAVVVEGSDLTAEQATQMGVLRQADMIALLKLLDEKFQRARLDS